MSYQQVIVQGRLSKDPEIKQSGDVTIVNFSVPVDFRKKGEKYTQWFNCVAFNKCADFVYAYFTKGKPILVAGELQTEEYQGKSYTKLIANRVSFVDTDASTVRDEPEEKPSRQPAKPLARQQKNDDSRAPWEE